MHSFSPRVKGTCSRFSLDLDLGIPASYEKLIAIGTDAYTFLDLVANVPVIWLDLRSRPVDLDLDIPRYMY